MSWKSFLCLKTTVLIVIVLVWNGAILASFSAPVGVKNYIVTVVCYFLTAISLGMIFSNDVRIVLICEKRKELYSADAFVLTGLIFFFIGSASII